MAYAGKCAGCERGDDENVRRRSGHRAMADAAVGRLTGASIIRGLTETKFGPREYASRAQSAVLLERMLQAMRFINS